MRRRQRANGNIEDNIPQVYRPLIYDDLDGPDKKTTVNTVSVFMIFM